MDEEQKKEVKEIAVQVYEDYNKDAGFILRRIADTPTDSLSVINRKTVMLNGALTARPVSSVAAVGQRYFDTTNNVPIWYTTAGWRNSSGSIVAQNN